MSGINFDSEVFYIHIPRTAGTSIEEAPFVSTTGHLRYRDYEKVTSSFRGFSLKDFFSFTFVRDPMDRFISAYQWCLSRGQLGSMRFKDVVERLVRSPVVDWNVPRSVIYDNEMIREHFLPQWWYVLDSNMQIPLDFVGKYEHLDRDWKVVCKKVGKKFKLPHANPSGWVDNPLAYTEREERAVKAVYRRDYELFYPEFR